MFLNPFKRIVRFLHVFARFLHILTLFLVCFCTIDNPNRSIWVSNAGKQRDFPAVEQVCVRFSRATVVDCGLFGG